MTADVASHFTTAGRVAHVNCILEIERFDERVEIVGVRVHVVSIPRLARATVSTTIMSDAAIAILGQEEHLVLKGVCRQRPAVTEHDRLSRAPIFVVNLRAIFCRYETHCLSPFS